MADIDRAIELLEAAVLNLETRGWCHGAATKDGKICLVTAMAKKTDEWEAMPIRPFKEASAYHIWKIAKQAIANLIGTQDLAFWNDEHGRTQDQVISVLKQARDNLVKIKELAHE